MAHGDRAHRTHARQHERGIRAGRERDRDHERAERRPHVEPREEGRAEIRAEQILHERLREREYREGDRERSERECRGLEQALHRDLRRRCAERLAHADLAHAARRPRGREIRVVHARDTEHETAEHEQHRRERQARIEEVAGAREHLPHGDEAERVILVAQHLRRHVTRREVAELPSKRIGGQRAAGRHVKVGDRVHHEPTGVGRRPSAGRKPEKRRPDRLVHVARREQVERQRRVGRAAELRRLGDRVDHAGDRGVDGIADDDRLADRVVRAEESRGGLAREHGAARRRERRVRVARDERQSEDVEELGIDRDAEQPHGVRAIRNHRLSVDDDGAGDFRNGREIALQGLGGDFGRRGGVP